MRRRPWPLRAFKENTEVRTNRFITIVLAVALCLALIAGCGKNTTNDASPSDGQSSSDSSVPNGSGGKSGDSKKDDAKKDDGKQSEPGKSDSEKDPSDPSSGKTDSSTPADEGPKEIVIPSATEGDAPAHYTVETETYSDVVGEVTAVSDDTITYKVYESKSGNKLEDYALFDPADYKATDKTATLQYDESTPFYTRTDDKWYISAASELSAGSMIIIATVEKTGELEGVIIFNK